MDNTIGKWTQADLARFLAGAIRTSRPAMPPSLNLDEVHVKKKLVVDGDIELSQQAVATLKKLLGL
jgi:hypothetical protein